MRGKTGAARIALATGCPVIPVGQWGAQEILPAYTARPHVFPRKTTAYKVGDPVDLADLRDKPLTDEVLHEATDRIMAAITALVEDLRGETAPAVRFDPKASGVNEIGNPHKQKREQAMTKVAVFGAGSWGTAFSLVLADAGNDVTIWGRRPEVCEAINERHENTEYFPGIELPAVDHGDARPGGGGRRRGVRRALRAVADAAREPRPVDRRDARTTRSSSR